ncbi:MAG: hypothetical protein AAF125_24915, partial [Chloroflexota bacterium]
MRSVSWLVAVSFAIITIIALVVFRSNGENSIAFLQEVMLREGQRQVETSLEPAFTQMTQIATSGSAQAFALETVSLSGSDEDLQTAQAGLIDLMETLLREGRGTYLRARYIMQTGSVWTEVTWNDGLLEVND